MKSTLVWATWANGDSDSVVFAYSVKGGSFTRYLVFLMALLGNGFGGVVGARVGDVSSGKVSAGSIRLVLERPIDGSQNRNRSVFCMACT